MYLSSLVTFDLGSLAMRNISSASLSRSTGVDRSLTFSGSQYAADASTSNSSRPEINPVYRADGTLSYVPGLGTGGKVRLSTEGKEGCGS